MPHQPAWGARGVSESGTNNGTWSHVVWKKFTHLQCSLGCLVYWHDSRSGCERSCFSEQPSCHCLVNPSFPTLLTGSAAFHGPSIAVGANLQPSSSCNLANLDCWSSCSSSMFRGALAFISQGNGNLLRRCLNVLLSVFVCVCVCLSSAFACAFPWCVWQHVQLFACLSAFSILINFA